MKIPPMPINEPARLDTLHALKVLDTNPEDRFDRITRIAQRAFRVPIALVSLVDSERQWFKSRQGICADETPRDVSFCGHAILDDELLIIPNALEDKRFQDNPLVLGDPHIRFYAGVPLQIHHGKYRVGTLCIIDQVPRTLDINDQLLLRDLGQMVQQELMSRQASFINNPHQPKQDISLLSRLSDFLQASRNLQEVFAVTGSLLPSLFPNCSGSIFTIDAQNQVEQGSAWGPHQHSLTAFQPEACWALRRGQSHVIDSERMALKCGHIKQARTDAIATMLCIPMIAQSKILGLFFLNTEGPAALGEVQQQLANTVAEQVGLAISNINLYETLQNQRIQPSSPRGIAVGRDYPCQLRQKHECPYL